MTDTRELEYKLLYSAVVAGKSAVFADGVMERLEPLSYHTGWFAAIRALTPEAMERVLRMARSGNYTKLARCFKECAAAGLDLTTVTVADLEKIHGIGPKTARFFVMWTRPEEKHAALDVHILRWLRSLGHKAPKSTPNGTEYARLEAIFLAEAEKAGKTPRELDWEIWQRGSRYTGAVQSV